MFDRERIAPDSRLRPNTCLPATAWACAATAVLVLAGAAGWAMPPERNVALRRKREIAAGREQLGTLIRQAERGPLTIHHLREGAAVAGRLPRKDAAATRFFAAALEAYVKALSQTGEQRRSPLQNTWYQYGAVSLKGLVETLQHGAKYGVTCSAGQAARALKHGLDITTARLRHDIQLKDSVYTRDLDSWQRDLTMLGDLADAIRPPSGPDDPGLERRLRRVDRFLKHGAPRALAKARNRALMGDVQETAIRALNLLANTTSDREWLGFALKHAQNALHNAQQAGLDVQAVRQELDTRIRNRGRWGQTLEEAIRRTTHRVTGLNPFTGALTR